MSMNSLLDRLALIVGPSGIISGEAVREKVGGGLAASPCQAAAIVRPANTDELSQVMRLCHQENCAVVPLGGLSGLVEGTQASSSDIAISLERMNQIDDVDIEGRTITVEAGAVLQTVQEIVEEKDLSLPIDLGARGSAMIGGVISTNAGGNRVIRYGMMRDQVLGLEVVLADGTIVSSMNHMIKNNAGYDLKHLFIGSEGTLGIVTRAVLRLRPSARSQNTAFIAANDFNQVSRLLNTLDTALGGRMSAFEVMWNDFYRTVMDSERNHSQPLDKDYPFYILLESMGSNQERDEEDFQAALTEAYEKGLYEDAVIAQSHAQRDAMWEIRDDIECVIKKLSPLVAFDVSLSIKHMQAYVDGVQQALKQQWPDAKVLTFGHLGDGNLHLAVNVGEDTHSHRHNIETLVYGQLKSIGGSISAEHGIGLEKRDFLNVSRTTEEISLMRMLKNTLDPKGILNPGKVLTH